MSIRSPTPSSTTYNASKGPQTSSSPKPVRAEMRSLHSNAAGSALCDACGLNILFTNDSGNFTMEHWHEHRKTCSAGAPDRRLVLRPVHFGCAKRRRAKRTEQERIDDLRSDPYVAKFEAYRVLCASCDRWIRLRPNSTYCSIPWDAHRKICLAKKNSKDLYALEERNNLFSKDPEVRKFDAERVLCNMCNTWLGLSPTDHPLAVKTWLLHRESCRHSTGHRLLSLPHFGSQADRSQLSGPGRHSTHQELAASSPSESRALFRDLNPTNYAAAHESRRRNAEQRAATLRADRLIAEVEPSRVFCSLCKKWIQLRQDSSYCAHPWLQHRSKCLLRHQMRRQKAAELAEMQARKRMNGGDRERQWTHLSDDLDAEPESPQSLRDDPVRRIVSDPSPTRKPRRPWEDETPSVEESPHLSVVTDDERCGIDEERHTRSIDLHSAVGRAHFVISSIQHLFSTTYAPSDRLSISGLLVFLNSAFPQDKYEEFDTSEVVHIVATSRDGGKLTFEGDLIHLN